MSEWQPIETAPKDGTKIIACRYDGRVAVISRTKSNIWRELTGNVWGTTAPTHWMHLPPPPEQEGEG